MQKKSMSPKLYVALYVFLGILLIASLIVIGKYSSYALFFYPVIIAVMFFLLIKPQKKRFSKSELLPLIFIPVLYFILKLLARIDIIYYEYTLFNGLIVIFIFVFLFSLLLFLSEKIVNKFLSVSKIKFKIPFFK